MKTTLFTILILTSLACSKSGDLDLVGDTGITGTNDTSNTTDTDTDTTTDTTTDTDTTYTTETNVFEEWAGSYTGNLELFLWGGSWSECDELHESSFEIDLDGVLAGTGECKSGWSYYPHEFFGEVDENGEISGVVSITAEFNGGEDQTYNFDFSGQINAGELTVDWIGVADMGNWEIDVRGEATAD